MVDRSGFHDINMKGKRSNIKRDRVRRNEEECVNTDEARSR